MSMPWRGKPRSYYVKKLKKIKGFGEMLELLIAQLESDSSDEAVQKLFSEHGVDYRKFYAQSTDISKYINGLWHTSVQAQKPSNAVEYISLSNTYYPEDFPTDAKYELCSHGFRGLRNLDAYSRAYLHSDMSISNDTLSDCENFFVTFKPYSEFKLETLNIGVLPMMHMDLCSSLKAGGINTFGELEKNIDNIEELRGIGKKRHEELLVILELVRGEKKVEVLEI